MQRYVTKLRCICYMDGSLSECGYRFCIIGYPGVGYAAFRTISGFKYFMRAYGLAIDASTSRVIDLRDVGHGRRVVFDFVPRRIRDIYFWSKEELPPNAQPFVGLENGAYVTLYAIRGDGETMIYRPNPNAKEVYQCLDYLTCSRVYG